MFREKKRLAIAVAGVVSLGTSSVQAVDFGATTTMQNTLEVSVVNDFDIGTVFATSTAGNWETAATAGGTIGVGALSITPAGVVTLLTEANDDVPALTSLSAPTPAQGSVDMVNNFTLLFSDTSAILAAQFSGDANLENLALQGDGAASAGTNGNASALVHETANPALPALYMLHFTVEAVSGGTVAVEDTQYDGNFLITQDFGETTFVFNIGATITTEPNNTGTEVLYEEGIYAGTFEVTAEY